MHKGKMLASSLLLAAAKKNLRLKLLLAIGLLGQCSALRSISVSETATPPLIDVPTYSMATLNADGSTNMNILTYATPVSVRPDRVWSIGLFKDTLSHENFCRDRFCILQLLKEEHTPLIKFLGGSSGKDVDKRNECSKLGFEWGQLDSGNDGEGHDDENKPSIPLVLPDCAYYLKLRAIGDLINCGSHDVAVCKVEGMLVSDDETKTSYVSTARLRELGLITEQGRVAD
jgi:flavin reductase (DIM6/NTAB) family NADH-FMN oxidoreductase RutF